MYVAFEGGERSGKGTQATLLTTRIGDRAKLVKEPSGIFRELLSNKELNLNKRAQLGLYMTSMAQGLPEWPEFGLGGQTKKIFVGDRSAISTIAYQCLSEQLVTVQDYCKTASIFGIHFPSVVYFMDIKPEEAFTRPNPDKDDPGGFEGLDLDFHTRLYDIYKDLMDDIHEGRLASYAGLPAINIVTLDATKTVDEIHKEVWDDINFRLRSRGIPLTAPA
ncbi:hypothetical protein LCGC14_0144990 [marine sediment metagenome]|uniref:dTMP kinase n=1 Tax=marine sediment metagenome TaxID=412755 RepID=A0A0F9VF57_9ZZZZ